MKVADADTQQAAGLPEASAASLRLLIRAAICHAACSRTIQGSDTTAAAQTAGMREHSH